MASETRQGSDSRRGFWQPTSSAWVAVAFFLVVASFIAGTIATEVAARSSTEIIQVAATSFANDDLPGILHIAAADAELHHVESLTQSYGPRQDLGRLTIELTQARRVIDAELAAFAALPVSSEEAGPLRRALAGLRAFDATMDQLVAADPLQHRARTRRLLEPVRQNAVRIAAALLELISIDASHARSIATQITRLRRRSVLSGVLLDGISATLSTMIAILVVRTVRHGRHLLEAHARFVEHRAEELEQFSARVAHDILSPLTAVQLSIELARRGPSTQVLERAEASLRRVQQIVDGLLAFARAGARPNGEGRAHVRVLVDELIQEALPVAERARIELRAPPLPDCAVACFPGVLASLVSNLLQNAIKYMGTSERRRITLRVYPREGVVRFEVEDTGPGIPRGKEDEIFEPYVRATGKKEAGIGLGLATVKRLVLAHGGRLGVRAAPGGGSLFWFELPRVY